MRPIWAAQSATLPSLLTSSGSAGFWRAECRCVCGKRIGKEKPARRTSRVLHFGFDRLLRQQGDVVGQAGDKAAAAGMVGGHVEGRALRAAEIGADETAVQRKALIARGGAEIAPGVIARAGILGVLRPLMADMAADAQPVEDGVGRQAFQIIAGAAVEGQVVGPGPGGGK